MKLWQFAVLWHPSDEQRKNGDKDKVVVGVTDVLAKDQTQAVMLAGRAIPEQYLAEVDQLEIAVRPF